MAAAESVHPAVPIDKKKALPSPSTPADSNHLVERIQEFGFWFHNIELAEGIYTCPGHPYGDFPRYKWEQISPFIPQDISGKSVLDIGCNAGFYSIEMKKRGAERVLGIDSEARYLEQARFAADLLGLDIELQQVNVYEIDKLGEQFDYVLFMGVLYHLRYPLYALDKVAMLVKERAVIQSLVRGEPGETEVADDYVLMETDQFFDPRFPRMFFIEKSYAHDPTNWWIPNEAGLAAMIRSSGLQPVAHPDMETFICEPIKDFNRWWMRVG